MRDISDLRDRLSRHGQGHLLRFFDELAEPRQQALAAELEAIDLEALDVLIDRYVVNCPAAAVPGSIEPADAVCRNPVDAAGKREIAASGKRGLELIAGGKVAAFTVAGGQGSRLGYEGPKGCLGATPVVRKPLFQIFAEQLLAAGRRGSAVVPWYIMTSPANDVATKAFFRQHDLFGLKEDDVFFLRQGTMPAIGLDGRLLLADKGRLACSPNGHGGSLQALRDSGALDDMARRGIELISYFQVDNPLVRCVDPVFLGLHDLRSAEMSAKALPKRRAMEKLGNFCMVDGKLTVIEYCDMPEELARATTDDGHLRFSAGSIAIHVLSRSFVEKLTDGRSMRLDFHRAVKTVPFVGDDGNLVQPAEPNAVKLEMFVFDALPLASRTVVLETDRSEEFSPIKNAEGEDSLQTSLHDQVRRAATWLEEAGVRVPRDADGQIAAAIEISPLLADSAEELIGKVAPGLTVTPGQNLYLD